MKLNIFEKKSRESQANPQSTTLVVKNEQQSSTIESKVEAAAERLDKNQQALQKDIEKYGGIDYFIKALDKHKPDLKRSLKRASLVGVLDYFTGGAITGTVKFGIQSILSMVKNRVESRKAKQQQLA